MAAALLILTLALSDIASAAPSQPLISGRVVAPAGASAASAASGTAWVFLDTTDAGAKRGTLRSIALGRVRGGSFRIAAPRSRQLARVAKRSEGWVTFLLMVRTPAGESLYPFSRRLGGGREASASALGRPDNVELFPYDSGAARQAAAPHRADCQWVRSRNYYRYTRVGQLHQWNGFRSSFEYATGGHADSNIGAAIERGGNWKVGASVHVEKTKDTEKGEVFHPNRRRFSRYLQTRFTYYYYYLKGKDCTRRMKVLRPGYHVGGSYYKNYNDAAEVLDGHCGGVQGQYKLSVAARSAEYTSGGKAATVSRGVHLLGVTLGSQSGWSKHVRTTWQNITNRHRAICSIEGDPNTASVTYVGGLF